MCCSCLGPRASCPLSSLVFLLLDREEKETRWGEQERTEAGILSAKGMNEERAVTGAPETPGLAPFQSRYRGVGLATKLAMIGGTTRASGLGEGCWYRIIKLGNLVYTEEGEKKISKSRFV